MVDYLVKEARVFVNAGNFYGACGEGDLRLIQGCYGDDERLLQSIERIRAALIRRSKTLL